MIHRQRHEFDVNIDAVDERSREPISVARDLLCRAMAAAARIPGISAGTRIHRGNQLKLRGELATAPEPRHDYRAAFQRFAQGLECIARKFRQLVEEQDAAMREA